MIENPTNKNLRARKVFSFKYTLSTALIGFEKERMNSRIIS